MRDVIVATETLLVSGRRDDALILLESALEEQRSRRLFLLLARVCLEIGTREAVSAAAHALERCRHFAPDDPETMAMLRVAYAALGQQDRVRAIDLSVRWGMVEVEPARARWPQG